MTGWDKLEEAEIHVTSAWIKSSLGFHVKEKEALESARANFSDLTQNIWIWPFLRKETQALHRRGVWGLKLADDAEFRQSYRIDN
jgi:hypothetical protein